MTGNLRGGMDTDITSIVMALCGWRFEWKFENERPTNIDHINCGHCVKLVIYELVIVEWLSEWLCVSDCGVPE